MIFAALTSRQVSRSGYVVSRVLLMSSVFRRLIVLLYLSVILDSVGRASYLLYLLGRLGRPSPHVDVCYFAPLAVKKFIILLKCLWRLRQFI